MDNVQINIGTESYPLGIEKKEFKSGKTGYFGQGKVNFNGNRYQAQVMLVEIVK